MHGGCCVSMGMGGLRQGRVFVFNGWAERGVGEVGSMHLNGDLAVVLVLRLP